MDDRAKMLDELRGVLAEVGADHALVGGLAVGYHGRERATVEVDLLVPRRKLAGIARALEARGHPVRKYEGMIRVWEHGASPDHDEAIADLVAREANPTLRAAAAAVEAATVLDQPVQIAQRGALVALKYHAATSPHCRLEDRYQDIADIGRVIRRSWSPADLALARKVAATIGTDAPDELERLLDDLRNDRPVKI